MKFILSIFLYITVFMVTALITTSCLVNIFEKPITNQVHLNSHEPLEFFKKFEIEYRIIKIDSWEQVQSDCQSLDHTEFELKLRLENFDKYSAIFSDFKNPKIKIYVTPIENYSSIIDEGLGSEINGSYGTKLSFSEIWEQRKGQLLSTRWKSIILKGNCYHLLGKIEIIPTLLKTHDGNPQ